MDFMKLAQARFSCKQYDGRPLEAEKLNDILEAGRMAPTAKNLQPQRIYVLQSEKALAALDAATPCRYNAPVVLVVAYDSRSGYTYPGGKDHSGIEDASIVATHMMLAAAAEGVDSCWLNFFDPEKLASLLKLPEHEKIVMALDLGYRAEGAGPLANHASRKPIDETVTTL